MNKTRLKIIKAAIDQIENSGLGVTTKQIAETAGVNELTLFRQFGTKQQLIIAAISETLGPIADTQFTPSGDLHVDLMKITAQYVQLIDKQPGVFVQILSVTDPELIQAIVLPLQQRITQMLTQFMENYKQRGALANIPTEDLIREFMGPLLARAFLWRSVATLPLDIDLYTWRFIHGHIAIAP